MFRGFMPALTLFVFVVGVGIGFAWYRGMIPLAVTSAKSGSLSPEYAVREDLPPPPPPGVAESVASNEMQLDAVQLPNPSTVPNAKAEPQLDAANVVVPPTASLPPPNQESATAHQERQIEQLNSQDEPPEGKIRTRKKNVVQLDSQSGGEEFAAANSSKRSAAPANQEPEEPVSQKPAAEADLKSLPPSEQLALAEEKLADGETLAAHRDLSRIYWNHKEFRPQLMEVLESTADAIFFQPKPLYVEPHVVRAGERLESIAKKYQLSWEYLATLNRTSPKRIQVDQKMKVMKGPFSAVVDIKDYALTIHLKGYFVKRYEIGIGKDGSSPIGKFAVLNKVENPQWTDDRTGKVIEGDDPTNPLGKRWIDLGDSYGIHGTIDPDSIGKAESRGCIRMRDKDIIEVYNFLVKGSEVVIRK